MDADQFQSASIAALTAFVDKHKKHGRCWKHDAPIRYCGCDPRVFLDLEQAQERELKRAKAYGRLLRMRVNKRFWAEFIDSSPPSTASPSLTADPE